MTSDETVTDVYDGGYSLAVRPDTSPIPIVEDEPRLPSDVEREAMYAELAHDGGHPAITLPPPPVLTPEEAAQEHLVWLWRKHYLGAHHAPDEWDPFWSHRFSQFIHTLRQVVTHATATAVPFCGVDAADTDPWAVAERLAAWRSTQERVRAWAASDAGAKTVTGAAHVTLTAQPGAPAAEQEIGARLAPVRLLGEKVKCGGCKRQYVYTDIDPYYLHGTAGYKRTGGRCYTCVLRPDGKPAPVKAKTAATNGTRRRRPSQARKAAAGGT
jgi:hypothetical protein